MFYQNFIPYIALQVNDHHELHAIAVRLGMNEYQFAAVLGAVSNNLLTKSQVILKNWRKEEAQKEAERKRREEEEEDLRRCAEIE